MSVQMGSVFRAKGTGRATKGARQPGLTAVPARWWHRIKPPLTGGPLPRWAALVKSAAMTRILLVGAPGKHHKIIKSNVALCPRCMSEA